MADMKTMEDKMNDLLEKNKELANHVQFWKMQYKRLDGEKFELQREYNESLFKKKEAFSKLKQIHSLLEDQMFEFSNKLTAFENIINNCDNIHMNTSRDIFSNSVNREISGNGQNIQHVPPMIKGVTLKTAVLVVPRANIDILNGSLNQSAKREKSPRKSNTPKNSPKTKLSETLTPKETNDVINTPSETSSESSDFNILNASDIFSSIRRRDPFVSLSRVDFIGKKFSNDNIEQKEQACKNEQSSFDDESKINIDEYQDNSKLNYLIPDSSDNKENFFSTCESFDEISTNEPLSFCSPRLECILERTEIDTNTSNASSAFSSKTPKKRRVLSSDLFEKSPTEDPLEGTSWSFKNDQNRHDEEDKINNISHDSLWDKIKELSNSNISESEEEKCNSFIIPQNQSTPKKLINIITDSPTKNEDNNILTVPKKSSIAKKDQEKKPITKTKKAIKSKSTGKRKTVRVSLKTKKTSSPAKKKSSTRKTSESRDSTSDTVVTTSRSRRIKKVNYKEMACNVKLRRN